MSKFNFDSEFYRRVIAKSDETDKTKSLKQLVKEAIEMFYDEFDYYPEVAGYAPGAFTIMGDHLEYTKGLLVEAALPLGTVVVGKANDAIKCKLATTSRDLQGAKRTIFSTSQYKKNLKVFPEWVNFIKAVIQKFPCDSLRGFDVVIHSNVPVGQGYGSSAALMVAFYTFLQAICQQKICKNKFKTGLQCLLGERRVFSDEKRLGQWHNITSAVAEKNAAVTIDCCTNEVSKFYIKDTNILFLLTYPNFKIERNDRDLIPIREMELRLIAEILGINHINEATQEHLTEFEKKEEPTKEIVIEILRYLGYKDYIIAPFVEDLFYFSKSETPRTSLNEEEFIGEGHQILEEESIKSVLEERHSEKVVFSSREQTENTEKVTSAFPVSYIHQRIAELCEDKVINENGMPTRPCSEVNCLENLENLSEDSGFTVISKLLRRLRHVITEKIRCLELPNYVSTLDYVDFGSKLIQSHLSLKNDFDVSCPTLDALVDLAIETDRVYGSKMMSGGGTLTLLHRSVAEELIQKIKNKFGDRFQFYLVFPCSGGQVVPLGMKKNPKSLLSSEYRNVEELMKVAVQNFKATFGYYPTNGAQSPGSTNLIGDHTDYNHGYVFSLTLNLATVVVGAYNGTTKIRAITTLELQDENRKVIFPLPENGEMRPGKVQWAKLIKGAVFRFKGELKGFDCLIQSNLHTGTGLSSKNALILAFYSFLEDLTGQKSTPKDKAQNCMLAEQEFSSIMCTTGEYLPVILAKENFASLLDCRANCNVLIPFQDPSVVLLLTFTLFGGRKNQALMFKRMEECYQVAKSLGRKTLRCLTMKQLQKFEKTKSMLFKRAKHVLTENERVLRAAEALKNNDFETLGQLMVDSHNSLRDDFEFTTPDLDYLVKLAMEVDGVFGSKMPCTGYQTCVVSLVKRWAVDDLIEYLQSNFCRPLKFFVVTPQGGCGPLNVQKYVDTLSKPQFVFEDIFPI